MSETTIDEAAKLRVKQALVTQAMAGLQSATGSAADEHAASEVDSDAAVSAGDTAQSSAELGLANQLEQATAQQQADLQRIQDLDVSPTDTVGVGALVGFDGQRYLVGVVSEPFDCDAVTYEGLSADAPIFAHLAGLRVGDSFTFRDTEHRVDFVA